MKNLIEFFIRIFVLAVELFFAPAMIIYRFVSGAFELGAQVTVKYGDHHGVMRAGTLRSVLADGLTGSMMSQLAQSLKYVKNDKDEEVPRRLNKQELIAHADLVRELNLESGAFKPEVEENLLPLLSPKTEAIKKSKKTCPALLVEMLKRLGMAILEMFFGPFVKLYRLAKRTWQGTALVSIRYGNYAGKIRANQLKSVLFRASYDVMIMHIKNSLADCAKELSTDEHTQLSGGRISMLSLEMGTFKKPVEVKLIKLLQPVKAGEEVAAPKVGIFSGLERLPLSILLAIFDSAAAVWNGIAGMWELSQKVEIIYGDFQGTMSVATLNRALNIGVASSTLSRISGSLEIGGRKLHPNEMTSLPGGKVRKLNLEQGAFEIDVEERLLPLLEKVSFHVGSFVPAHVNAKTGENDQIFNDHKTVIGIEVTIPELAAKCARNIDPQHTGGDSGTAAIESCMTCEIPPKGSALVTNRADLDSVGSMVVLAMRLRGVNLSDDIKSRINLIADVDKFANSGKWEAKPLPKIGDPLAAGPELAALKGIGVIISNFRTPLAERVAKMDRYILTGDCDGLDDAIAQAVAARNQAIEVSDVTVDGGVAVVVSTERGASELGYCLAPVLVAKNPQMQIRGSEKHIKFTVCQYAGGFADMQAIEDELNSLEQNGTWGGQPNIKGSPQGVSSSLTLEQVVEVMKKHLIVPA